MKFESTGFDLLYVLNYLNHSDSRGCFVKTFNDEMFKEKKINFSVKESYYSISNKGVLRGMHFQLKPCDHDKLVYVTKGKILDVVLDLRKGSVTYGKYFSVELSGTNNKAIFIPKGFAHGFYSYEDGSTVVYSQSTVYNPDYDSGIHYNSFGFKRPNVTNVTVSERDKCLPQFKDFKSEF